MIRDHVNGFDLISKLVLQRFRYTSGNGVIASRGAIANIDFHLFLLCVIVICQILPHTGSVGKRQTEIIREFTTETQRTRRFLIVLSIKVPGTLETPAFVFRETVLSAGHVIIE